MITNGIPCTKTYWYFVSSQDTPSKLCFCCGALLINSANAQVFSIPHIIGAGGDSFCFMDISTLGGRHGKTPFKDRPSCYLVDPKHCCLEHPVFGHRYHTFPQQLAQILRLQDLQDRHCCCYCYLLPPTYYLLPTSYYLLPTTSYLLPPTSYLLPATCYLLPASSYLLPTTYYLLPTTYYVLPPTYYLLPTT